MDPERMKSRCVNFTSRYAGTLHNYKLVFSIFKNGAWANIVPSKGSAVEGVVYETDETVNKLDKYEIIPGEYIRHEVEVITERGILKCLVYIANPKAIDGEGSPTKEYMDHLLKGEDLLSEEYFEKLESIETCKK